LKELGISVQPPRSGRRRRKPRILPHIGWREWVSLPDLQIDAVKAKIDTGARTSAIHAWNIAPFEKNGELWVRFELHPLQRNNKLSVLCEAPVKIEKTVRSSNGAEQARYFIETNIGLGELSWPIELSLANRDQMGFRMLLGRTALRRRLIVDPARSYLLSPALKRRKSAKSQPR